MKKRIMKLSVMMLIVMVLAGGCGAVSQKSTDNKESDANRKYKVAMICDSSISDGGWGAASYNAMQEAAKKYGFETQYTDNLALADFASSMRSYCDLGFDLIFAPGNEYSDAVKEVAADYPNVHFALLNGILETDNVVSLLPDAKQIGYMAGALAGLMSKTNQIGFIGGMELDTTKEKSNSYEAAAKKVNANIKVVNAYAGSFNDTAKGKEIANSMISMSNADVLFGDASAVDSGAREALAGYKDRFDIGQPSDLLAQQKSDVVIGSVVTDNAVLVGLCMSDVIQNTYGNKTIYGDLANGCLSVGTLGSAVSDTVKSQYMDAVESIKNGTFIK